MFEKLFIRIDSFKSVKKNRYGKNCILLVALADLCLRWDISMAGKIFTGGVGSLFVNFCMSSYSSADAESLVWFLFRKFEGPNRLLLYFVEVIYWYTSMLASQKQFRNPSSNSA